jgi:hypothetical protein
MALREALSASRHQASDRYLSLELILAGIEPSCIEVPAFLATRVNRATVMTQSARSPMLRLLREQQGFTRELIAALNPIKIVRFYLIFR